MLLGLSRVSNEPSDDYGYLTDIELKVLQGYKSKIGIGSGHYKRKKRYCNKYTGFRGYPHDVL